MARILLDTHAFLWFILGNPRFSPLARSMIEDEANETIVSIVTPWEIAIKTALGKLALSEPYEVLVPREIAGAGFLLLPITLAHTATVASLPRHHGDPFDRMLVAQATVEGTPILSADETLDAYGIDRIW